MSAAGDISRGRSRMHQTAGWLALRAQGALAGIRRHRQYVALGLFVGGWSSVWASGLRLIDFLPEWISLAAMVAGLCLVPWVTKPSKADGP